MMTDNGSPTPSVTYRRRDRERLSPMVGYAGLLKDDEEIWQAVVGEIVELGPPVFNFQAFVGADGIEVTGEVATKTVKTALEKLLSRSFGAGRITSRIEVTPVFRPAEVKKSEALAHTDSGTADNGNVGSIEPTSVERYPSVRPLNEPAVGEEFDFEVALDMEPDPSEQVASISFSDIPADWRRFTVDTDVFSDQLELTGPSRQSITVIRDGRSRAAQFSGRVLETARALGCVNVRVHFSHNHRFSGEARFSFALAGAARPAPATPAPAPAPVEAPPRLEIDFKAQPAAMTVQIVRTSTDGTFIWVLDAPDSQGIGPAERVATATLGTGARDFATKILKQCPKLSPEKHADSLQGYGEDIWRVTPGIFKELYRALREKLGPAFPIQIITDEPYVPWEMAFPDDSSGVEDRDHLFMRHPIARWFPERAGRMIQRLKRGMIASFVPDYGPGETLPAAIAEGEWLEQHLSARPLDASYASFVGFWGKNASKERVAILHFAGHGASRTDGSGGLRMSDLWVGREQANSNVVLGKNFNTFAVLNACEVGGNEPELHVVDGWPASLIKREFGGVLAPLWAVRDAHASEVVRQYLGAFVGGTPLGEAMRAARAAQRDASSTPYAYICYGDVMARFET